MLPSFCRQSITVKRPAETVERGSKVRNWSIPTTHTISGCSLQPDMTSSDFSDRAQSAQTFTLYAPINADLLKGDRIVYGDVEYDVVGVPFRWYSPSGANEHTTCKVTVWEG